MAYPTLERLLSKADVGLARPASDQPESFRSVSHDPSFRAINVATETTNITALKFVLISRSAIWGEHAGDNIGYIVGFCGRI